MSNDSHIGIPINSAQIYDGGHLTSIAAEDLKGNLVAIRQLINNHNENSKRLEKLNNDLSDVKNELEFQNTYPYVAIFAALASVIGTALVGVGVNMVTESADDVSTVSVLVLVLGGLLVLVANIFTILYRWVRRWFNKSARNE